MKIIGITSSFSDGVNKCNEKYINAFKTDKTLPIILPMFKYKSCEVYTQENEDYLVKIANEYVNKLDGLVLTGGQDINPLSNGDMFNGSVYTNINRDYWEMILANKFLNAKKPIIGICRGMQVFGVMYGMKLCQDLASVEDQNEIHNGVALELPSRDEPVHEIELYGDFRKWTGVNRMKVNSLHHQGFLVNDNKDISRNGLELLAKTPNIIEAFRHIDLPMFGCQWHPEEFDNSYTIRYIMDRYF